MASGAQVKQLVLMGGTTGLLEKFVNHNDNMESFKLGAIAAGTHVIAKFATSWMNMNNNGATTLVAAAIYAYAAPALVETDDSFMARAIASVAGSVVGNVVDRQTSRMMGMAPASMDVSTYGPL